MNLLMSQPSSRVAFRVTINSVDVTQYVNLRETIPTIASALDEELDTLSIILTNGDTAAPIEWQEIIVYNGFTKIFGGYVMTVEQVPNGANNNYVLGCSDYGALFEKVYVKAEYSGQTDAQIIAAAVASSTELSGYETSTYVRTVTTFPRARFNRKTIREILDWICQQTGGHWYVDYDKKVHYFGSEEANAPFDITDDALDTTKKLVEGVKVTLNGSAVVNQVDVVGGSKYSDNITEYYSPSGYLKTLDFSHRYKPASTLTKIQVKRNDGGATTNLVLNPSFENNLTDGGWQQGQGGTGGAWYRDANVGAYGSYVLQMVAGTSYVMLATANNHITLAPGEWLSASVLAWCLPIGKASIVIKNTSTWVAVATDTNRLAQTWERLVCTFKNESSANVTVRIEISNNANDSATPVYFDGVQAEKKSWSSDYCDGSRGTGYAWTGTAHNSTSTRIDMPIWTTLTVKTGGVETLVSPKDVLYYESTSRIEQRANFPGLANGIEVYGRYEMPMRVRINNSVSQAHYGRVLQLVVNAPEIIDKAVGVMRGKAELAANAFANTAITYITQEPGLQAGQSQGVRLVARHLDSRYLIQRVTTTVHVAGYIRSEVELGAVDQSLVGLLLDLKRASGPMLDWNENEIEVIDEVVDINESLTATDAAPTVTTSTGPYNWDGFNWDYGVWG